MSVWGGCKADTPGAVRTPANDYRISCGLCQSWDREVKDRGQLLRNLPDGRTAYLPCPSCDGSGYVVQETWSRERYKGAVLADRERNYHDDSDFYAVVWDEDKQAVTTVEWGTTRFACVGCSCTVDATEEVREKARVWMHARAVEEYKDNAKVQARRPEVGKLVQTVNTRKVVPGTRGVVFWIGEDQYKSNRYHTSMRVGVELEDGSKAFFAIHNVEVVAPGMYLEDVEAEAERYASGADGSWHRPFVAPGMISM